MLKILTLNPVQKRKGFSGLLPSSVALSLAGCLPTTTAAAAAPPSLSRSFSAFPVRFGGMWSSGHVGQRTWRKEEKVRARKRGEEEEEKSGISDSGHWAVLQPKPVTEQGRTICCGIGPASLHALFRQYASISDCIVVRGGTA